MLSGTTASTCRSTDSEAPAGHQAYARRRNFLYQDGVVVSSVLRALDSLGLLDTGPGQQCGLPETGYLRVVRRCLASVGWFDGDAQPATWTPSGRAALRHRDHLMAAGRLLARFAGSAPDACTTWDAETSDAFSAAVGRFEEWHAGVEQEELVGACLEGALLVPVMLSLRADEGGDRLPRDVERFLALLGWVDAECRWTRKGRAFREYGDHFGLAGLSLPLLARLEELLRGELVVHPGDDGWHGERELHVWAGSAARRRYFADADPIFQEVFAYGRPPAFIADMGCGDGSWLAHLHAMLGDSVRYVGIDASPVALDAARRKLRAAGVRHPLLLSGDVASPQELRARLAEHGLSIEDGLHIRSFHLLREGPMRHAAASIADVLAPGGKLVFNAPDLGPATRNSVLFHDPNRLLRKHWLNALDAADPSHCPAPLREAVARVGSSERVNAQKRADSRILPTPQSIEGVVAALEPFMTGTSFGQTFELLAEENLATALVPSNQAEYLAEITDRTTREEVIRFIMREHVFPEISKGPAGTGLGYNVEWKFGVFERL